MSHSNVNHLHCLRGLGARGILAATFVIGGACAEPMTTAPFVEECESCDVSQPQAWARAAIAANCFMHTETILACDGNTRDYTNVVLGVRLAPVLPPLSYSVSESQDRFEIDLGETEYIPGSPIELSVSGFLATYGGQKKPFSMAAVVKQEELRFDVNPLGVDFAPFEIWRLAFVSASSRRDMSIYVTSELSGETSAPLSPDQTTYVETWNYPTHAVYELGARTADKPAVDVSIAAATGVGAEADIHHDLGIRAIDGPGTYIVEDDGSVRVATDDDFHF